MGYMGLTLASGLSLYFIVSNLIGILQYAMLGKVNWKNILPFRKSSGEKPVSPAKSVATSRKGGKKK
jgi:YidC/Oxa1 family membrane protein insertase